MHPSLPVLVFAGWNSPLVDAWSKTGIIDGCQYSNDQKCQSQSTNVQTRRSYKLYPLSFFNNLKSIHHRYISDGGNIRYDITILLHRIKKLTWLFVLCCHLQVLIASRSMFQEDSLQAG